MSITLKENTVPSVNDIDDDWDMAPVPIEDDPFFTKEDIERIRKKAENADPKKCIKMSFEQFRAVLEAVKE